MTDDRTGYNNYVSVVPIPKTGGSCGTAELVALRARYVVMKMTQAGTLTNMPKQNGHLTARWNLFTGARHSSVNIQSRDHYLS